MANFKSQKEIIQSIDANLEKLESGNLSMEELELHVDMVRELYERTVVLRYKAFENSVGVKDESRESEEVRQETAEDSSEANEELSQKETLVEEVITEEEIPAIEFSLFEEEEEIEDERQQITNDRQVISAEKVAVPEPIIEEITIETPVFEEISEPVSLAGASEFLSKFQSVENEMTRQLGFSKLETLVGSFGLNERLQYINELFDGSSEVFSDAIKSLDTLPNINSAKSTTADLAIKNNWDVESDTVEEFIQKICRRYA